MNYKTLSKREESIAENCRCSTYRLSKMALKGLYYNLSVSVYPACPVAPGDGTGVAPEDGTGVSLWLNYCPSSIAVDCYHRSKKVPI